MVKSHSPRKLKVVELLELNEPYNKVLLWFFSFPNIKIGLNDLSVTLNISKNTAKSVVNKLIKEGFLNKEEVGKAWRIYCNNGHVYNYSKKIAYNLTMIYQSSILEEIHKLIKNPRAIILFGSYRKGDDTENSDIDIAVETLDNEELKIIVLGIIPLFGYRKNVKVNVHIFSRNKVDLNLFSNISNGIILEGFLEVRL